MKCLNCEKQLSNPRAKYCSDKCRMAYRRRTRTKAPEQIDPNKPKRPEHLPGQKQPEHSSYKIVADKKVYGRQEVIYEHEKDGVANSEGGKWTTRPEPENPDDIPDRDNRCVYKRKDGTRYIIDAVGGIYPQE